MNKIIFILISIILLIPLTYAQNFSLQETSQSQIIISGNAPTLNTIPDFNIYVNNAFSYQITATDPNNDPLLFYDDTSLFEINRTTGIISFTPTSTGTFDINISVSDSTYSDWQIVKFTITTQTNTGNEGQQQPGPGGNQPSSGGSILPTQPNQNTSNINTNNSGQLNESEEILGSITDKENPAQQNIPSKINLSFILKILSLIVAVFLLFFLFKILKKIRPRERVPVKQEIKKEETPANAFIITDKKVP